MADQDPLQDLQDQIYEAVVLPELWPRTLAAISTFSDTAGTALLSLNERGVRLVASPSLEAIGRRVVEENWMARSGRAQGVMRKGLVGTPRFLTEVDYFDAGDLERDPLVTELFRPAGLGWAAGWLQTLPHGDTILLNVEQFQERGPIHGEQLRRLDAIYATIARAAAIAARNEHERVRTAIDTLTTLGLPAAALTRSGGVFETNALFGGASHIWTTAGGDRLALHDRVADRQLLTALDGGTVLSIPIRAQQGGLITAVLQIVPIRRAAQDVFSQATVIVMLSEIRAGAPSATLVQSLFDLTPAELVVAKAIAAGQTLAGIAARSGRSIHTVRDQLKSVMSKTGSARQAELIVLMQQLGRING